ncbi:ATP-binding cassette domain-containing protein [bacterium]|nr:ATP-binding cassette domain-containing protein [bacterium]
METSSSIVTRNLCRTFEVRRKSEGFLASLKGIFWPRSNFVRAVSGLDMEIQTGELVGFLGPNGAGKTTTLKMLSGLIFPTSGSISVLGFQPFQRDYEYLGRISLVMGQKQNLWWDLPPIETLAIHREIYNISQAEFRARLDELVEMLEIVDCLDIQARKLSLGQRMRCELAVALLHRPQILFLDEPTIGLDILMQKRVRAFLLNYHERFRPTILLTSHYMEDVIALVQRVIVINRGLKIYDGTLNELSKAARLEKILTVTFQSIPEGFSPLAFGKLIFQEGPRFQVKIPREKAAETASNLYSTGKVLDLTLEEAPIEEVLGELFAS